MALIDALADAGRGFQQAAPFIFQTMSEDKRLKAHEESQARWRALRKEEAAATREHQIGMAERDIEARQSAAQAQRDFLGEQGRIGREATAEQAALNRQAQVGLAETRSTLRLAEDAAIRERNLPAEQAAAEVAAQERQAAAEQAAIDNQLKRDELEIKRRTLTNAEDKAAFDRNLKLMDRDIEADQRMFDNLIAVAEKTGGAAGANVGTNLRFVANAVHDAKMKAMEDPRSSKYFDQKSKTIDFQAIERDVFEGNEHLSQIAASLDNPQQQDPQMATLYRSVMRKLAQHVGITIPDLNALVATPPEPTVNLRSLPVTMGEPSVGVTAP